MALTALKVQDLADRGFISELFGGHDELWRTKSQEAYDYAVNLLEVTDQPVRPDDVLPLLVPALEVTPEFREFLENKRLTQKYWRTYFAEYLLDRFWRELTG